MKGFIYFFFCIIFLCIFLFLLSNFIKIIKNCANLLLFFQKTRLIKIIISKDRCGFHEDALHYDSVISLIEYYKRNSLKEYNVHLAIQLLFPLKQQNAQKSFWVKFWKFHLFAVMHRFVSFLLLFKFLKNIFKKVVDKKVNKLIIGIN